MAVGGGHTALVRLHAIKGIDVALVHTVHREQVVATMMDSEVAVELVGGCDSWFGGSKSLRTCSILRYLRVIHLSQMKGKEMVWSINHTQNTWHFATALTACTILQA